MFHKKKFPAFTYFENFFLISFPIGLERSSYNMRYSLGRKSLDWKRGQKEVETSREESTRKDSFNCILSLRNHFCFAIKWILNYCYWYENSNSINWFSTSTIFQNEISVTHVFKISHPFKIFQIRLTASHQI